MARKNKVVVPSVETIQSEVVVEAGSTEAQEIHKVVVQELEEAISTNPSPLLTTALEMIKPTEVVAELVVTTEIVEVPKVKKNQGVGIFVKNLISEGLSNKDIMVILNDQYGPDNTTTYACVAWYRNKMKKAGAEVKKVPSALESVQRFLSTCTTISEEEKEGLLETVKQSA